MYVSFLFLYMSVCLFFKQPFSYTHIYIHAHKCLLISRHIYSPALLPMLQLQRLTWNLPASPALLCVSLLAVLQLPVMTSGLLLLLLDDTSGAAPKVRLLLNCCSLIWLSSLQLSAISALEQRVSQSEVNMSTPAGEHYQVCPKS